MYDAVRVTNVPEFEYHMEEFRKLDLEAYEWLSAKDPTRWSKSHFQTYVKSDMLLNNLCESFNNMIKSARDQPILGMLERIRLILMKMIHVNRSKMQNHEGLICPKIQNILEKNKVDASFYTPDWSGESKFEVSDSKEKHVTDLNDMTCTYRKWDLTGILCKHGVSALFYAGLEPEKFVHHCYTTENYMKCYNNMIGVARGSQFWKKTGFPPVLPPFYAPKPGQKQHKRRLEPDEKGNQSSKKKSSTEPRSEVNETTMTPGPQKLSKKLQNSNLRCGNCLQVGHNKRRYKEDPKSNPQPQVKKRKRTDEETGSRRQEDVNINKKKQPSKRAKKNKFPVFMGNIGSHMTFEHNQLVIQLVIQPVPSESVSSVGYANTVMQTQASQAPTNAGREPTGGPFVTLLNKFIGGDHVLFSTKPTGGPSTQ